MAWLRVLARAEAWRDLAAAFLVLRRAGYRGLKVRQDSERAAIELVENTASVRRASRRTGAIPMVTRHHNQRQGNIN